MMPADLSHRLADLTVHGTVAAVAVSAVWWRFGWKVVVVGY